jgi:hypothetical protein
MLRLRGMFRKKNFWLHFLTVFVLIFGVVAAGFGVKKLRLSQTGEKKLEEESAKIENNNQEEKTGETEAAAKNLPADDQVDATQLKDESQKSVSTDKEDTSKEESTQITGNKYFIHKNITVTFFWVGEGASKDNNDISNSSSAWDEKWAKHFGGVDNPKKRNGFFPAGFTPKENPFYFALPYNDFDSNGKRKQEVYALIPWAKEKKWGELESVCKNRWIKIAKGNKTVYAQWQDVGPFKEDDKNYVFGKTLPKSKINNNAGLDVSPAVKTYLGLSDIDKIDWQFVDSSVVPDGPWKKRITTSQVYWE